MFKCKLCNKEFETKQGLLTHLSIVHKLTTKELRLEYFVKYENYDWPKCIYCGNPVKITSRGFGKCCNSQECEHRYACDVQLLIHKNNPQLRINARNRRLKYLQNSNNFIKTAWGIRASKKHSFLEEWFINKVIIPYKLYEKYDIVNEFCVKPYFMDFAFINAKIDIELDGRCHFEHGTSRLQHDIDRDIILNQQGWNIYRISYIDVENNSDNTINNILDYLNGLTIFDNKKYFNNIYSNNEIKSFKEKEKQELKESKLKLKSIHNDKIKNMLISLEETSNIDFSKFGWVTKAFDFLNKYDDFKCAGNLQRYISKYYPEFFIHNDVFHRK